MNRTVEINATPTMEWGNGNSTLVFLHYFGGAARSWQWVAEQLENYRCVAMNLPGFGGMPALEQPSLQKYSDAISDELARLDIENYTLVGHSMGGKMALHLAANSDRAPQQVVLIAPSPPTQEPMPDEEKQRLLDNHPSQKNAETTVTNAVQASLTQEQQAVAIDTQTIAAETAWRWWLQEGMTHSIAQDMPQIQMPVTVLASQDDPVIPYDTIQNEVLAVIPEAHVVTAQGVGHLIPLEAADWVATQIRRVT